MKFLCYSSVEIDQLLVRHRHGVDEQVDHREIGVHEIEQWKVVVLNKCVGK